MRGYKFIFLLLLGSLVSYNTKAAFNGTYTINPNKPVSKTNYQTIFRFYEDLTRGIRGDGGTANGAGISGPVKIVFAPGIHTGQMLLKNVYGLSATNTLSFVCEPGQELKTLITQQSSDWSDNNFVVGLQDVKHINFYGITFYRSGGRKYGIALYMSGTDSVSFRSCHFISTQLSTENEFAEAFRADDIYGNLDLVNCKFQYGNTGLSIQNNIKANGILISKCTFDNSITYSVNINSADSLIIENCRLTSTGLGFIKMLSGIKLSYCGKKLLLKNNRLNVYATHAIAFANVIGTDTVQAQVYNNVIYNSGGSSVYMKSSKYIGLNHNSMYSFKPVFFDLGCNYISVINTSACWQQGARPYDYAWFAALSESDHNNFYGPNFSLTSWQTYSGRDSNSVSAEFKEYENDTVFLDDPRLKLRGIKTDVLTDINGNAWDTIPEIGAYAFKSVKTDVELEKFYDSLTHICSAEKMVLLIKVRNKGYLKQDSIAVNLLFIQNADTLLHIWQSQKILQVYEVDTLVLNNTMGLKEGEFRVLAYVNVDGDENRYNDTLEFNGNILLGKPDSVYIKDDTTICNSKFTTVDAGIENILWFDSTHKIINYGRYFTTPLYTQTVKYHYSTYSAINAQVKLRTDLAKDGYNSVLINPKGKIIIKSITVTPKQEGKLKIYSPSEIKTFTITKQQVNKPVILELNFIVSSNFYFSYGNSTLQLYEQDSAVILENIANIIFKQYKYSTSWFTEMNISLIGCESEKRSFLLKTNILDAKLVLNKNLSGLSFGGYEINPDKVCAGNNMYYEVNFGLPKDSFTKTWEISNWSILPAGYFNNMDASLQTGGGSFWPGIQIAAKSKHIGRTFQLKVTVKNLITGCDSTVSKYFRVWPAASSVPQLIDGPDSICLGNDAIFSIPFFLKDTVKYVQWQAGDGSSFLNTSAFKYKYKDTGTYVIKVTVRALSGCNYYYQKTVKVLNPPKQNFTYFKINNYFFELVPKDTSAENIYKWFINSKQVSTKQKPLLELLPGKYNIELYIVNMYGCGSYTKQEITIWQDSIAAPTPKKQAKKYVLYPNPTNGQITIKIQLEEYTPNVFISILNTQGQLVKRKHFGDLPAGEHIFNFDFSHAGLAQGTYFFVLNRGFQKEIITVVYNGN